MSDNLILKHVRMPLSLIEEIERRVANDPTSNFSTFVRNAIVEYLKDDELSLKIKNLYNLISDIVQYLEIIRDYETDNWDDKTQDTYNIISKMWDDIRKSPHFLEPEIADDFDDNE